MFVLPREDSDLTCQTSRAPDYYGLGVRLGIYFAWMQAYVANTAIPSEIAGAADTNTIFLLTLLISMIKCSSVDMLSQVDALILLHLGGGSMFGVLSIWGYRTRQYADHGPRGIRFFGGWGSHARLLISAMVSGYGVWFWTVGLTSLPAMPGEGCGTLYTFLFTRLRADGGVRYVYLVMCALGVAYFGVMLLASSLAGVAKFAKMRRLAQAHAWAESSKLRFSTGFNYGELVLLFRACRVLNMVWIVWSMVAVEFTLNYNNISAVLGGPNDNELHLPAQLLPLLIGAFGFVRTLYLGAQARRAASSDDGNKPGQVDEPTLNGPDPLISGPVNMKSPLRAARTLHLISADIIQAFSPAMARPSKSVQRNPDEVDEYQVGSSTIARYLVAWLPWLSLLRYLKRDYEPKDGREALWAKDEEGMERNDWLRNRKETPGPEKEREGA